MCIDKIIDMIKLGFSYFSYLERFTKYQSNINRHSKDVLKHNDIQHPDSSKHNLFLLHMLWLLVCCIAFASTPTMAQRESNNIFLFDCTGSMKSNKLWDAAKNALEATIRTQASIPGSHFTVIPFGDTPYENFSFEAADWEPQLKNINNSLDKHIAEARYTHISNVLEAGFKHTDPNKDNKIYLLTDGMPNYGDSPQKVAQTLNRWCANHHNTKLFYVALTNGVVDPTIKQAIDECNDAYIVQCENRVIPQFADVSTDIYTNLMELAQPRGISISLPGRYALQVENNDPLFEAKVKGNQAVDGRIDIFLVAKNGKNIEQLHELFAGREYVFNINIHCADTRFKIVNPTVRVHVSDEVPSKLTLLNGEAELQADGAKWYDSFLWVDAAPEQKVMWDLTPQFKNHQPDTGLQLRFAPAEGQDKKFKAWYNGTPILAGDLITILPGMPAKLELQFDHDAAQGKRYFKLTPAGMCSLDMINEQPSVDFEGSSLRTSYSVGMNPLKLALIILGLVLLAALILWFLIFKRWMFPTIKLGRMEIIGPDTYYNSKKIKGARKVVLTSRTRTQSAISLLFTGKVIFVKGEIFKPELQLVPSGNKKKVKIKNDKKTPGAWEITPSSLVGQDDQCEIRNRETSQKSKLIFN